MSDRSFESPALRGPGGDLVFVRVSVPSRLLEHALDALAQASFPVNPEIRHLKPDSEINFPAYASNVDEIRGIFRGAGLNGFRIAVEDALVAMR